MGISIGAIALILLIGVSGCIVARRTAPMRADWARKRALREPLTACGLTRHLQQAGVGDDEQVLERAAAWLRANKPGSVEDIIQFGLVPDLVGSLLLPPIPKEKLLAALIPQVPAVQVPGVQVPMQPVPMAQPLEGIAMGTVMEPGLAGGASSSSTQPTLAEAVEILKRDLGLKGNVHDVLKEAAFQLSVDSSLPLVEMARQCVQKLGV